MLYQISLSCMQVVLLYRVFEHFAYTYARPGSVRIAVSKHKKKLMEKEAFGEFDYFYKIKKER